MASSRLKQLLKFFCTCVLLFSGGLAAAASPSTIGRKLLAPPANACANKPPFAPVLAFGDSTTDTGNAVRSGPIFASASEPPYGETFFKQPTGRFSDDRLMVDFLCAFLKVPLLQPHLAHSDSSANENFAVAGATSLDVATLQQLANVTSFTSDSLSVQVRWFKEDTARLDLSNALVYFGEIGGNDYNYALAAQRPPQVMASLISSVINEIESALDQVLSSGVRKVVVQGQFPMGCLSLYLKLLGNTAHDQHGCIESVTQLSNQHNTLLRGVVASATAKYPDAKIVFLDTSAAYQHIMDKAAQYGFTNVQDPCFIGGLVTLMLEGSSPASTVTAAPLIPPADASISTCSNPQNYIGWDGIHLTDAMYGTLVNLFLTDPTFSSPFPNFLSSAAASCSR